MKIRFLGIVVPIADHAAKRGIFAPNDAKLTQAIKTEKYYGRTLTNLTRTFYQGYVDEFDLVGIFADLISGQMRRAYIEGLRDAEFNPKNMTGAMYAEIDAIVQNEHNFVLGYAADLVKAKEDGTGWEQFKPRIDIWVNRYEDIVNRGSLAGAMRTGVLLEWTLGDAEHCNTCISLDGTVATAYQWHLSGFVPQHPPNAMLDCGGWNCQCSLRKTDKAATIQPDGILTL